MTSPNEGSAKKETPPEALIYFALGGCASLLIIYSYMVIGDHWFIYQEKVFESLIYWFVALALSSAVVAINRGRS